MRTRRPIGLLIEHIVCGGAGPHVWVLAVQPDAWPAVQLDFEVAGTSFCGIPLSVDGQRAAVIACAARPFTAPGVREFERKIGSKGNTAGQMSADKAAGFLLGMAHGPAAQAAILSTDWERIAAGLEVGNTLGLYLEGK